MNALGGGLRVAWALKEAQFVLFPSHPGYRTLVLFAHPPTPCSTRCTRVANHLVMMMARVVLFLKGNLGICLTRDGGSQLRIRQWRPSA